VTLQTLPLNAKYYHSMHVKTTSLSKSKGTIASTIIQAQNTL